MKIFVFLEFCVFYERNLHFSNNFSEENNQADAIVPVQSEGKSQFSCAFHRRTACLTETKKMFNGDDWSQLKFLAQINARNDSIEQLKDLTNLEFFLSQNQQTRQLSSRAKKLRQLKTQLNNQK